MPGPIDFHMEYVGQHVLPENINMTKKSVIPVTDTRKIMVLYFISSAPSICVVNFGCVYNVLSRFSVC